jgi:putative membrane protein
MKKITLALAAAAFAVPAYAQAPGTAPAQTPGSSATQQESASAKTQQFIEKAAIGDMYEIQSSKMALEKAQNDQFKSFAQKIVDDHTQASNEMKSIVGKMQGIKPPAELDAKHKQMIDKLQSASGAQFNQQYRTQQIDAHNEAIRLYQDYANSDGQNELKQFANKILPKLKDHLQMAQALPQGSSPGMAAAPGQNRQAQAAQQGSGVSHPATAQHSKILSTPGPQHILVSDLTGTTVYGTNNENIGEVNDVVLDRDGKLLAVVVGVGGFLGIGEKDVAIPFEALQVSAVGENAGTGTSATTGQSGTNTASNQTGNNQQGRTSKGTMNPDRIVLKNMTKQDLENAPKFEAPDNR